MLHAGHASRPDAMEPGVRSGKQIERLPACERKPVIKDVAHLVEVDAVEDVGAFRDQIRPDSAVAVDEYGFNESEVGRGVARAPVLIARGPERRGKVVVQREPVGQAGGSDGIREPAANGYNRSQRHVRKYGGKEIPLAGFERSGIHRISDKNMRDIKDRGRTVQAQPGRPEPVLEAGEINDVVYGLAPGVIRLELQVVAVSLGQGSRHPVVNRVTDGFIGSVLDLG